MHAIVHLRAENPPAKSSGYTFTVNGVLPIAPPLHDPRLDAVLLLESTDGSSPPSPPTPPAAVEARIYGARLLPEVIVVSAAGAPVLIRNDDRRAVTLTCAEAPQLLPSGPLPPGARLSVTPTLPGELMLRSVEYPHLRATMLVARGFATRLEWGPVGEVGVARLDLPPGNYKARLFYQHRYVLEQSVTVAPEGSEFVLRPGWQAPPPRQLPASQSPLLSAPTPTPPSAATAPAAQGSP